MRCLIANTWLHVCGYIGQTFGFWLPVPTWVERAYLERIDR